MKLLFILPEYHREPVGGIRTFYLNLLPALAQAGCQVKVLLARREFAGADPFIDDFGVEVEYVKAELLAEEDELFQASELAGRWLLGQFWPVANAAFQQVRGGAGYDLVELTDWPLIFLPWVAQLKAAIPYTISLHSSVGQMIEFEGKKVANLDYSLVRMYEALCFGAAPSLHSNSNLNARYWEKITNRKVDVLLPLMGNSGLTTKNTNVHEREDERGAWSLELGVEENAERGKLPATSHSLHATAPALDSAPRVRGAVFARLQNWKGCELLASALRELPDVEIHWYGADMGNTVEGRMWSESLARNFPKIFGQNFLYKGVVEPARVPDLMAESDFVCVPSLWDVFNLSAVEAMGLGCVALCSRQAGAEMLIEDGVSGFVFDPENPLDLIAKLQLVASLDPANKARIQAQARRVYHERLSPKNLALDRIAYYKKTVQGHQEENSNPFLPAVLTLQPSKKISLGRFLYKVRKRLGF